MSDNELVNETYPNLQRELHRPRHFNKRNLILNQLGDKSEFLTNPSLAELDRVIDDNGKIDQVQKGDNDKTVLNKVKFTSVKKEGVGWIRVKLQNNRFKNIGKYLNDQVDKDKMDQIADKKFRKRKRYNRNLLRNGIDEEDETEKNSQTLTEKLDIKAMSYFPVFFANELPSEIHKYSYRVSQNNNANNINNNYLNTVNDNYFDYDDYDDYNNYINTETKGYYINTEEEKPKSKLKKNKNENKDKYVKTENDNDDDENQKIKVKIKLKKNEKKEEKQEKEKTEEVKEKKEKKEENSDLKSNIIRKVKKKLVSKSMKKDKNISNEKEKNDHIEYNDDKEIQNEKNDDKIIKRKNKKNKEVSIKKEIKDNDRKINHESKEIKDNNEKILVHKKNGRKFIGSYKSSRISNVDKEIY